MSRIFGAAMLAVLAFGPMSFGQGIQVKVTNGKHELVNAPIRVAVQWPKGMETPAAVPVAFGSATVYGQLTEPTFSHEGPAEEGKVRKDLVFIAPKFAAGETVDVSIKQGSILNQPTGIFSWKEQTGDWAEISFTEGDKTRPVMRYMHKTYDPSSIAARNKTYKVFHHLYDPAGTRYVTNGGHTDSFQTEKDLLYPHHRGLMFGINKVTYGANQAADTWHCTKGVHVSHAKTLFQVAGPVLAEHRVLLTWHGQKDDIFAEEERQMSVYNVPGGTLVEFATRLKSKAGKVKLDGDPQHAGFQFRASNDVAKQTAKQTYYLRPDGKGNPGETRNWEPKTKVGPVNLPWNVVSFVLGEKRYSVAYLDHPANPGEKRYSERDYARFGCYFEYDLTPSNPLTLNHRVWLQDGEMTAAQVETLRSGFVDMK